MVMHSFPGQSCGLEIQLNVCFALEIPSAIAIQWINC
jgi:hypothetical protein